MTQHVSDIASGLMDDGERTFVPRVNCWDCGRFVGRDGWIEFEFFEMSDALASVTGQCRRCCAAQQDHETTQGAPA